MSSNGKTLRRNIVGQNDNRQSLAPGSTTGDQDEKSRRLGVPLDTARARPPNDITAPGILPSSGPLRTMPTDHFVSTPRGNRAAK
jgi:hypothetical protein